MKKLNLQLGSIKELLSQEQMKKITGGNDECYESGGITVYYSCEEIDPNIPGSPTNTFTCEACANDQGDGLDDCMGTSGTTFCY